MLVEDVMERFPATIRTGTSVRRAAELIAVSEVAELMVLGDEDRFVGVLAEDVVVRAVLPTAEEIAAEGATLRDAFAAFLVRGRALADDPVDPLVVRDVMTIRPGDDVAAAAMLMVEHDRRRVPVVEDGRLRGSVACADVCRAVLAVAAARPVPAAAQP